MWTYSIDPEVQYPSLTVYGCISARSSCFYGSVFIMDLDFAQDLKLLMIQMKGSVGVTVEECGLNISLCYGHMMHLRFLLLTVLSRISPA